MLFRSGALPAKLGKRLLGDRPRRTRRSAQRHYMGVTSLSFTRLQTRIYPKGGYKQIIKISIEPLYVRVVSYDETASKQSPEAVIVFFKNKAIGQ